MPSTQPSQIRYNNKRRWKEVAAEAGLTEDEVEAVLAEMNQQQPPATIGRKSLHERALAKLRERLQGQVRPEVQEVRTFTEMFGVPPLQSFAAGGNAWGQQMGQVLDALPSLTAQSAALREEERVVVSMLNERPDRRDKIRGVIGLLPSAPTILDVASPEVYGQGARVLAEDADDRDDRPVDLEGAPDQEMIDAERKTAEEQEQENGQDEQENEQEEP